MQAETNIAPMSDSISNHDFQFVRKWLKEYVGQDLGDDKQYFVLVNLNEIVSRFQFRSITELITRLESIAPLHGHGNLNYIIKTRDADSGKLIQDIVDCLMVNETYFFRRPSTFDDIRQTILPDLMAKRQTSKRLRICCMACSTGQEPYSLLMTMDSYFPELLSTWDTLVVATDISQKSLQRAQAGLYSDWETSRGLDPATRSRYFEQESQQWRISRNFSSKIIFRQSNLVEGLESLPFWPYDLILLRNVMIYFDAEAKRTILQKIRGMIASDGFLLIGESETLLGLDQYFAISTGIPAICIPRQ